MHFLVNCHVEALDAVEVKTCNAFGVLELCKNLGEYLNAFYKKSLISLTNKRINQKIFGVKPHRLDPGLTIVAQSIPQNAKYVLFF